MNFTSLSVIFSFWEGLYINILVLSSTLLVIHRGTNLAIIVNLSATIKTYSCCLAVLAEYFFPGKRKKCIFNSRGTKNTIIRCSKHIEKGVHHNCPRLSCHKVHEYFFSFLSGVSAVTYWLNILSAWFTWLASQVFTYGVLSVYIFRVDMAVFL